SRYSPNSVTVDTRSGETNHLGEVRLWDVRTGQALATLQGHTANVFTLAISPDGLTLASGSEDNTVRLWEVKTGQRRTTLQGHTEAVRSVAFSPDGLILASAGGKTVRLWDATTGQLKATLEGHKGTVTAVAFSPDGQRVFGWDFLGRPLA